MRLDTPKPQSNGSETLNNDGFSSYVSGSTDKDTSFEQLVNSLQKEKEKLVGNYKINMRLIDAVKDNIQRLEKNISDLQANHADSSADVIMLERNKKELLTYNVEHDALKNSLVAVERKIQGYLKEREKVKQSPAQQSPAQQSPAQQSPAQQPSAQQPQPSVRQAGSLRAIDDVHQMRQAEEVGKKPFGVKYASNPKIIIKAADKNTPKLLSPRTDIDMAKSLRLREEEQKDAKKEKDFDGLKEGMSKKEYDIKIQFLRMLVVEARRRLLLDPQSKADPAVLKKTTQALLVDINTLSEKKCQVRLNNGNLAPATLGQKWDLIAVQLQRLNLFGRADERQKKTDEIINALEKLSR